MRVTNRRSICGFTIIEVLVCLMIVGMFMAAIGAAFNASAMNYRENKGMFEAMNLARQVLLRITTELRSAQAVAVIGVGANDDSDNSRCSLITASGINITYVYDSDSSKLSMVDNSDSSSNVLCDKVAAMTFDRATVVDDPTAVRNVRISMQILVDGITQKVSTAAVVRRNL